MLSLIKEKKGTFHTIKKFRWEEYECEIEVTMIDNQINEITIYPDDLQKSVIVKYNPVTETFISDSRTLLLAKVSDYKQCAKNMEKLGDLLERFNEIKAVCILN